MGFSRQEYWGGLPLPSPGSGFGFSPGSMHDAGCLGLVHWTAQRDGRGREAGGGFGMGNTCIPVVDSF